VYYDSDWHLLDQILLSPGLLGQKEPRYVEGSLQTFAPRTVTTRSGGQRRITRPNSTPITFDVQHHEGGSDHLPLIADFDW